MPKKCEWARNIAQPFFGQLPDKTLEIGNERLF
jgi:hypothetical protein